jgi:6-pyruvoyltetrahydropterin/6-carboxytetrahydropterin synthase
MYEIKVKGTFSSAHNLRSYKGKCEKLHGHNWIVEASVASDGLDKGGMVLDFSVLKKMLGAILEELDHTYLNEHPYFKKNNPSSENMAKYIYDRLNKKLSTIDHRLSTVTVWENERSCATYTEGCCR